MWCFPVGATTRSCRIDLVHCPYCSSPSTRVVDSRLTEPGDAIRRRRECEGCSQRFTTYERAEAEPVTVRKRNGKRERFDRQKLLRGLNRAANKRPVTDAQLESLADAIAARVRRLGPEADAELIGELCLRGLSELDPVSGVMFASVYRNFDDLAELEAELQRIRSEPVAGSNQLALDRPSDVPSDVSTSIGLSPRGQRRGAEKKPDRTRSPHA
jgi:transcriptional repressor NrdR